MRFGGTTQLEVASWMPNRNLYKNKEERKKVRPVAEKKEKPPSLFVTMS
jgi:hypothetical protein